MVTVAQAAGMLAGHDRILILTHQNPDGDALGCAFGLCHALQGMGKAAQVRCSDPVPAIYHYLLPAAGDTVTDPDFIVSVDLASQGLFGPGLAEYADRVDLCIDHHGTNTGYAAALLLDTEAAAAAELVWAVLKEMGVPLTGRIADCIYTGLSTDTGCFRFQNVTARTFRLAAETIDHGADYQAINRLLFETRSKSRIALEREALETLTYHGEGRIAVLCITTEMLARTGAVESELEGISAVPRQIEGVEIGITLRERPGGFRVSVRTDAYVDAAALCGAFGGGGHARAAGCTLSGSRQECCDQIVRAARQAL